MGVYLNSKKPYLLFREDALSTYYVDKSDILKYLVLVVESREELETGQKKEIGKSHRYICITRPRRFGKTVMANMISSYFCKENDSSEIFRGLKVSSFDWYEKHLNQHNVMHIMFNEMPRRCRTYDEYIERIETRLLEDLIRAYPDAHIREDDALWDAFNSIIEFGCEDKFIFILDEWDFIFHRDFVTEENKAAYIDFLSNLLKDQPYVELAYMTGILPIKKYGTHSALNMFSEFSMINPRQLAEFVGFTEEEVSSLCSRYGMDLQELREWYNGYRFESVPAVYNPRSVVEAVTSGICDSYWNQTETFEALRMYIDMYFEGLRDDVLSMMAGEQVPVNTGSFSNDMTTFHTKDDVLTLLIHLGYLGYDFDQRCVFIPNHEIRGEFGKAASGGDQL